MKLLLLLVFGLQILDLSLLFCQSIFIFSLLHQGFVNLKTDLLVITFFLFHDLVFFRQFL